MREKMFFEKAKQVKVCEKNGEHLQFSYAIAIKDMIVFADTGTVVPIEDDCIVALEVYPNWVDFSEEISE